MMYQEDWEKSLNIDVRFSWATKEQKIEIMREILFQRKQGYAKAIDKLEKMYTDK